MRGHSIRIINVPWKWAEMAALLFPEQIWVTGGQKAVSWPNHSLYQDLRKDLFSSQDVPYAVIHHYKCAS